MICRIKCSEFILTVKNDFSLRYSDFNLTDKFGVIFFRNTYYFFKKNSLVFPVRRIGVRRIMRQFAGINTDTVGNIFQFQNVTALFY